MPLYFIGNVLNSYFKGKDSTCECEVHERSWPGELRGGVCVWSVISIV